MKSLSFMALALVVSLSTFCGGSNVDRTSSNAVAANSNQNVVAPSSAKNLCDLLAHAADYDGKEVEVNAILIIGRETAYLYDPECRGKKEKEVWYGIEDSDESRKLDSIDNPENPEYKEVGLIRARADFRGILMVKKNKGFGHMGYYLYNLRILQINNVTQVERDVPYPWQ